MDEILGTLQGIHDTHKPAVDLGCGIVRDDDFISVDRYGECTVRADVTALPFKTGSIGYFLANNLLEHLTPMEAQAALTEWKRALKPGGKIIVMVPAVDLLMDLWAVPENHDKVDIFNDIMGKVYAVHDKPGMGHKWGYTVQSLALAIHGAGFKIRHLWTHFPERPTINCTVIGEKALECA